MLKFARAFKVFLNPNFTFPNSSRRYLCAKALSTTKKMTSSDFIWDMKASPDELAARADDFIHKTRLIVKSIGSLTDEAVTFENLLQNLADLHGDCISEFSYIDFPQHVSPNKELREASNKAEKKLKEFLLEIAMDRNLFHSVVALQKKKPDLNPQYQKFLDLLILKGKRNALHLSKELQDEIKALNSRINILQSEFQKNLNEVTTCIEFSPEELNGLPQDFINGLEKSPDTGICKVTMKYPHYFPIMNKAKNPETRKRMLFAFNTQCLENAQILEELIMLRHKCALKLGYPNHATFKLEINHSKTPDRVSKFRDDLAKKLQSLWTTEKATLLEVKEKECQEMGLPFDGKLNDYDIRYYQKKVEELFYKVDENKIQEYFPLHVVSKGLLDIYQNLLGLTFKEVENPKVWQEDVQMFSVEDTKSGKVLGYFFLDLFPREGKYGHAAVFPLQPRYVTKDGNEKLNWAAMVANFTKPTATKPSLLTHDEVETYFHEFGHVMHQICASNDIGSLNYLEDFARDFIEAPSQMLENWVWEVEPLRMMSSHYLDQSPMADDMMKSLIKSRNAGVANKNLRQIVLLSIDLEFHTNEKADIASIYRETQIEYLGYAPLDGTNFVCNFGHMANGYDAGYYGYLWSEVFCMDMYATRFKGSNMFNPDVGMDYRKKILEVGQTKTVDEMLKDFLGREPSVDAFLVSKGIQSLSI